MYPSTVLPHLTDGENKCTPKRKSESFPEPGGGGEKESGVKWEGRREIWNGGGGRGS